ncbi:dynamin family protein [Anabaena sp. PCC 7108]|uniref:dynamin family protein n=1 Tax=Anabaena sp. PCC 7108 TaxID=163908 RepID=UPI00034B14F0|nr:dynamin family protein [Anabaena sp. PCC 7108]
MKSFFIISKSIRDACQFLNHQEDQQLIKDVELICKELVNPDFRIAVLAPFNFGKSTLINAMLGREIMPAKMVRTTGTVISIKYGETLTTLITLKSGQVIRHSDTKILQEFAVLNKKGQRREDVISVQVLYPNELLKNGVEIFDLPGTNDSQEQDTLVRDKLLQVDLVIQILSAKQPFTLDEQNKLNNWLINRGIKTFIFILNWMNEIESKYEKNEVYNDAYSTIKKFKSDLPLGVKKLYRVDALPAIKAKQERNIWKTFTSGIITFNAGLFTIISIQKKRTNQTRLLRIIAIADRVKFILQTKVNDLDKEIRTNENIRNMAIEKGKQREKYLREEFKKKVEYYRNWLYLNNILGSYQSEAAQHLERGEFYTWQDHKFKPTITNYIQSIETWANQSCDEFRKNRLNSINISLPSYPNISLPKRQDRNAGQWFSDVFNGGVNRRRLDEEYERKKWESYKNAIYNYLSEFSQNALISLNQYEQKFESLLIFTIPPESSELIQKRNYLKYLNSSLDELQSIESLKSTIHPDRFNWLELVQIFILFWKNWILFFFQQD